MLPSPQVVYNYQKFFKDGLRLTKGTVPDGTYDLGITHEDGKVIWFVTCQTQLCPIRIYSFSKENYSKFVAGEKVQARTVKREFLREMRQALDITYQEEHHWYQDFESIVQPIVKELVNDKMGEVVAAIPSKIEAGGDVNYSVIDTTILQREDEALREEALRKEIILKNDWLW